jgi:hypothetical protein
LLLARRQGERAGLADLNFFCEAKLDRSLREAATLVYDFAEAAQARLL